MEHEEALLLNALTMEAVSVYFEAEDAQTRLGSDEGAGDAGAPAA